MAAATAATAAAAAAAVAAAAAAAAAAVAWNHGRLWPALAGHGHFFDSIDSITAFDSSDLRYFWVMGCHDSGAGALSGTPVSVSEIHLESPIGKLIVFLPDPDISYFLNQI